MHSLPLDHLPPTLRGPATFAAAILHALARDEFLGRRPQRLLEPGLATWNRFKGKLGTAAFLQLLLEDACVTQALPFSFTHIRQLCGSDNKAIDTPPEQLPPTLLTEWLELIPKLDLDLSSADYIFAQARLLGLPTRLGRSDLHRVKPHQHALELPGTGGQLAHHVVTTQDDLYLQDTFTIACGSWQELTLAGIICADLGIAGTLPIRYTPDLISLVPERGRFALILGLDPSKGGAFEYAQIMEKVADANTQVQLV